MPKRKGASKGAAAAKPNKKKPRGKKPASAGSVTPASGAATADQGRAEAREALFQRLADQEDPSVIGLEGIGVLCEELGLDATTDIRAMVLCFKLGSKARPGEISREEFMEGMQSLHCGDVKDLERIMPSLDLGFMEKRQFRDFYRFAFRFNLEGTMKTLAMDDVLTLLPMAIHDRSKFLDDFIQFLPQSGTTRVSADQWNSFLEFSRDVSEDLQDYDDAAAWPVLLDEFVDWLRNGKLKKD
uniref:Defective in cullin neddylation protein n=1 Tax=Rhizochromulina marina TaxID=1034831 RepID=A0A7S2SVP2_9STRA|mmetsp:Transcript_9536/g.27040  ORF Transcript_9536/g.27040 Transcript_9536/m.27040 type:complete len:242 (+) Transcript_9536:103-828(+)